MPKTSDVGCTGLNLERQLQLLALFDGERSRVTNLAIAASEAVGTAALLVARYAPLSTLDQSIVDLTNANDTILDRVETRTMPLA